MLRWQEIEFVYSGGQSECESHDLPGPMTTQNRTAFRWWCGTRAYNYGIIIGPLELLLLCARHNTHTEKKGQDKPK